MNDVTILLPMAEKEPMDEFASLYHLYEIEKESEVIHFVRENPFLLSILEDAPNQIYRIFGKDVKLCLELHHDPEEGWDELFIIIKSSYSTSEAIKRKNQLVKEWFLGVMKFTQGKLNITEEPL